MYEVNSSADLLELRSHYMQLWESGFDGTLEIRVAEGDYPIQQWSLEPASDSTRKGTTDTIDVVLYGGGVRLPPPSVIRARTLRIEDVVLQLPYETTRLIVGESVVLSRSLIVDSRSTTPGLGIAQLAISGRGDTGSTKAHPVRATIEDTWFVGNMQSGDAASLLGFGSVETAPTYWDTIAIDGCAFLADAFAREIELEYARRVTITDSVFYKSWADGVLIASTSSGDIDLRDSVVVVEDLSHIARRDADSPPIELGEGTRVYVTNVPADAAPDSALALAGAQILSKSQLSQVDEKLGEIVGAIQAGTRPAELDQRLRSAVAR